MIVYTVTPVETTIPLQLVVSKTNTFNFTTIDFNLYLVLPENSRPYLTEGLDYNETTWNITELTKDFLDFGSVIDEDSSDTVSTSFLVIPSSSYFNFEGGNLTFNRNYLKRKVTDKDLTYTVLITLTDSNQIIPLSSIYVVTFVIPH